MAQNVTIYTSNTCAYCEATKTYFNKKSVSYDEINIDEQPERRQELVELSGQMAVPVTIIKDDSGSQDITVGYDVGKLARALNL